MQRSHLDKIASSYAQIAEGGKHEKSAMDWNKSDDKPKGKKVSKDKMHKCTCESYYLKRLEAMNSLYAEQYRNIAEVLIGDGYESPRLIDNIIESLPMEVVGPQFVSALKAVNPRINENNQTAEKKQARAIVEQQYKGQNALQAFTSIMKNSLTGRGAAGIKADADRHKRDWYARQERNKPGYQASVDKNTKDRDTQNPDQFFGTNSYGSGGSNDKTKPTTTKPTTTTKPSTGPTQAQMDQKAAEQQARTREQMKGDPRMSGSGSSPAPASSSASAAPSAPAKPKPTGPITSRAAIAGGSKEGQGPKSSVSTYRDPKDTKGTSIGRYRTLAQHRAAVAKNKLNTEETQMNSKFSDWREDSQIDEGLKQARKNVGADTCWDGYKAKGTKKKNGRDVPNCVKEEETIEEKKGLWDNIHAKRKRGEKPAKPGDKDYPKTLDIEEGAMSKDKEDHDTGGFRISDKKAKEAKDRLKKKMNIRGNDSEEQKKRLEKKRGMKLDDHPQFKKDDEKNEDYSLYDICFSYLDENYILESVEDAEEVMMQLTGAQIVEIIDEYMNMDESMASASRMKEIKSQGVDRPARSREFEQRLPAKKGSRGREFEHGSTRSSNTPSGNLSANRGMAVNNTGRARSQEFEHGSTRSRNTPSGNLADRSARTKDGKLMH